MEVITVSTVGRVPGACFPCLGPCAYPLYIDMCSGWWWIRDPETLDVLLKALHPRGIREKALHKHLSKHKDFLQEVCLQPLTGK